MPQETAKRRPDRGTVSRSNYSASISVPASGVSLTAARPAITAAPDASAFRITDLPDALSASVAVDPETGEWIWTGPTDRDGYGRYRGEGVHRLVHKLLIGPIPPGLQIDHVRVWGCTSRACLSPWHLEAVPGIVNVLRGTSFAAVNAAKTRCDHGHEYDLFNTYYRPDGRRDCRKCTARRQREYQARERAKLPVTALAPGAEPRRAA